MKKFLFSFIMLSILLVSSSVAAAVDTNHYGHLNDPDDSIYIDFTTAVLDYKNIDSEGRCHWVGHADVVYMPDGVLGGVRDKITVWGSYDFDNNVFVVRDEESNDDEWHVAGSPSAKDNIWVTFCWKLGNCLLGE